MEWTEEQDAKLRAGIQNRMSARLIGESLGVTRNSVLGRVFRLGLHLNGKRGSSGPRGPYKTRNTAITPRMRNMRLNPSDYIDHIMDLRDVGLTWGEISAQTGISVPKLREWAIAFGGHRIKTNRYFTDEELQYIIGAWRDHVHLEDMADKLGRSFGVMRQKIMQMQRVGMLRDIERDPAKTRLLRVYGEKALAAGATPSEALANIAEAKKRAMAEAMMAARMAATKRHKLAVEKMLMDINAGGDRNQAIFEARAEGATLEEIAEPLNLTRERVRQICFKQAELIALHRLIGEKQ